MSVIGCGFPDCTATVETQTIHRISPKGTPFRGRCEEHLRILGREPDDTLLAITDAIEFDNLRRQLES